MAEFPWVTPTDLPGGGGDGGSLTFTETVPTMQISSKRCVLSWIGICRAGTTLSFRQKADVW